MADAGTRLMGIGFRQRLRSPWLYACWLMMSVLSLNEFANAAPGRAGLISIDRVNPSAFLSQGWILAVVSLIAFSLVFLTEESVAARLKHSGFSPILLSSGLDERQWRYVEIFALPAAAGL